jgi:hypothetical protein
MNRDELKRQLDVAATRARQFAQRYVHEALPERFVYDVQLNCSTDGNKLASVVRLYPEDSQRLRGELLGLAANEVVDLLYRDGRVPQWIDASIVFEDGGFLSRGCLSPTRQSPRCALFPTCATCD